MIRDIINAIPVEVCIVFGLFIGGLIAHIDWAIYEKTLKKQNDDTRRIR
jgi:hypothetical protein